MSVIHYPLFTPSDTLNTGWPKVPRYVDTTDITTASVPAYVAKARVLTDVETYSFPTNVATASVTTDVAIHTCILYTTVHLVLFTYKNAFCIYYIIHHMHNMSE